MYVNIRAKLKESCSVLCKVVSSNLNFFSVKLQATFVCIYRYSFDGILIMLTIAIHKYSHLSWNVYPNWRAPLYLYSLPVQKGKNKPVALSSILTDK